MMSKEGAPSQLALSIHEHSLFFDRLVDLIPARFYVPVSDGQEKPWYHGLSKAAKACAKRESRENIKKARRSRYDPKKTASTLDVLQKTIEDEKKALFASDEEKPKSENGSGSDHEAEVDNPRPVISGDRFISYEELRERLHRKIEEKRGNRPIIKKDNKNERDSFQRKRKRDKDVGKKGHVDGKKMALEMKAKAEDISYGKVKLGGLDERGTKKRKLSKKQELVMAIKLKEAKKDPGKGKATAEKNSWRAAMSRALGEKIHDDPKVIKQSLKKEKKMHQKHSEKWKERIEMQNKAREDHQKTRNENIRERIQQKKMKKIEKREKKLLRPGFEGRKDGYQ